MTMRPRRQAVPNLLTMLRMAMAAAVFALLSWPGVASSRLLLLLAAGLFVSAALTDALDGHLARRWNAVSRFGRVMDPVADKVLVLGGFICLAGPGFLAQHDAGPYQLTGVLPWMAVVVLARELLVTSLRAVYEADGVDFSATLSGKIKMILQSIAIPIILLTLALADPAPGSTPRGLVLATAWSTVLVTALSGVPYVARAARAANSPEGT